MSVAGQISISDVQSAHQDLMLAERTFQSGDLDGAQRECERLLERHPDYFAARSLLGKIQMQRGAYGAALPHLVRAVMKNPNHWEALANLGKAHLELDCADEATRCLQRALELGPDDTVTRFMFAEATRSPGDYSAAAEALEQARAMEPGNARLAVWLGQCRERIGDTHGAAEAYVNAAGLLLSPYEKASVLFNLSELPAQLDGFDLLKQVEELAEMVPHGQDPARPFIAYARAKAFHWAGRHEDAWREWREINARIAGDITGQRQDYFVEAEELLEKAAAWAAPKAAKGQEPKIGKMPVPLIIAGPSRTGKTSLERLIGAADGVKALGEHKVVRNAARAVSQSAGLLSESFLANLAEELDDQIAHTLNRQLNALAGGADFVTITHPGLIFDAGRIAAAAPHARFVFLKRDADDNAFRISSRLYKPNTNVFGYDVDDIYEYLALHDRVAGIWLEKLAGRAIEVTYEELVGKPEDVRARVADLCGLKTPTGACASMGDDRGCAAPYKAWLDEARSQANGPAA